MHAGPLLDWLFGRRNQLPAYPAGPPIPLGPAVPGSNVAGYAPYGYPAVSPQVAAFGSFPSQYPAQYTTGYAGTSTGLGCSGTALPSVGVPGSVGVPTTPGAVAPALPAATVPPTASFVPNFNSVAARTPVTYYRPVVTTDPATGAQRVVMAPCSSFEYQTRRVPALGRRSLFGSLFGLPPRQQPLPQAQPTYTIPSGGIPVAVVPMIPPTYATAYGAYPGFVGGTVAPYGAMQPAVVAPGTSLTPAAPLGGFAGPSSCNVPSGTTAIPGLVAPPATSAPATGGFTVPGTVPSPATVTPSPGIYPPGTSPSSDPAADIPPSLPSAAVPSSRPGLPESPSQTASNSRRDLRSVVSQPSSGESGRNSAPASSPSWSEERDLPVLRPIPVPEGYQPQRRWNPGLLSEDDLTARRETPAEDAAVDYKPIHWASFQSPADDARERASTFARPQQAAPADGRGEAEPRSQMAEPAPGHRLRPITPPSQIGSAPQAAPLPLQESAASTLSPPGDRPTPRSYSTSGWRAAR
ncbi:MAG: hypothetical protein D6753_12980 [Planctomycetota bacterium]|nr:MAG: hypothetical protein D6753_12980 [Planctomycetota bacterium]